MLSIIIPEILCVFHPETGVTSQNIVIRTILNCLSCKREARLASDKKSANKRTTSKEATRYLMPTGACGIHCDACRLNHRGLCSSCGSGMSEQARLKIKAQERLLGAPCPILACARLNRIDYCLRECDQFPCENFSGDGATGYPFSEGYLNMQKRRRVLLEETNQNGQPGEPLAIPDQHWQVISDRGTEDIVRCSGATLLEDGSFQLEMLNRRLRIDVVRREVEIDRQGQWQPAPPLPAFVAVVYLANSRSMPLSGRWVSEKDLSCREFFRGPHEMRTEAVLTRFGSDDAGFLVAAKAYGGVETGDVGDAAVRLWVFPAIPLKLILWCGDDELEPALTVMFDQSIDALLPGDGIWALVQMVCEVLAEQSL